MYVNMTNPEAHGHLISYDDMKTSTLPPPLLLKGIFIFNLCVHHVDDRMHVFQVIWWRHRWQHHRLLSLWTIQIAFAAIIYQFKTPLDLQNFFLLVYLSTRLGTHRLHVCIIAELGSPLTLCFSLCWDLKLVVKIATYNLWCRFLCLVQHLLITFQAGTPLFCIPLPDFTSNFDHIWFLAILLFGGQTFHPLFNAYKIIMML